MNQNQKLRFTNHTLCVSTRGTDYRQRHFVLDLQGILPHSKKESKIESTQLSKRISELCYQQKCDSFVCLEHSSQLYLWVGRYPTGPSIKFTVDNIHTVEELQLAGNFAKSGKAILSFDKNFEDNHILKLCKQVLTSAFKVPRRKFEKPLFADRVITFLSEQGSNRIWFRHYEITQDGEQHDLSEIGPRFVLQPVLILDGLIQGKELYRNPIESAIQSQVVVQNVKKNNKRFKAIEKVMTQLQKQEFDSEVEFDDEYYYTQDINRYLQVLKDNAKDNDQDDGQLESVEENDFNDK